MCLASGESAGLVRQIKPAAEIVHEMMNEARRVIEGRLAAMLYHEGHGDHGGNNFS
jgi:enoyl-[acyl-carrier protein] reductase II